MGSHPADRVQAGRPGSAPTSSVTAIADRGLGGKVPAQSVAEKEQESWRPVGVSLDRGLPRQATPARKPSEVTFRSPGQIRNTTLAVPGTMSGKPGTGTSAPFILDFGVRSKLPAILIAPPSTATPIMTAIAEAEGVILEEFLAAVTTPQAEFDMRPPVEMQDEKWDNAVVHADERYRVLLGNEAFQRRSLEAARATLAAQAE